MTWDPAWPLKPDVVFEGGNVAKDQQGATGMSSLNLLTTNHRPNERLFTTTNATSAASALCARMAAQIMATYPAQRAETVRALIVHSARWTPAMRQMYLPANAKPTKKDYVNLIRHCGWGMPDLDRALWSAGNSLTLVVEDLVHPYGKDDKRGVVSRDMNLHALPWPKEELEALGDAEVQLHVTLSYFIEPNPARRGWTRRFRYASHGLRFDVRRPVESTQDFRQRLNRLALAEEEDRPQTESDADQWFLGPKERVRGSLHLDVWSGPAAELAARGCIAVFPVTGWWKEQPKRDRSEYGARYCLIVSIESPQVEVDLWTPIAVAANVPIQIET